MVKKISTQSKKAHIMHKPALAQPLTVKRTKRVLEHKVNIYKTVQDPQECVQLNE